MPQDKLTQLQEQVEILGIMSHRRQYRKGDSYEYELLPIDQWTTGICKEINQWDFYATRLELNKKDIDSGSSLEEVPTEIWDAFSDLGRVKENPEKIYIYPDLPEDVDYVRFSKRIILKNLKNKTIERCISSIYKDMSKIRTFNETKKCLLDNKENLKVIRVYGETEKRALSDLRTICAVASMFSISRRRVSDNVIWNELLQNANDHIPDSGGVLQINIDKEKRCLRLEYPDEGFSVRDFVAICTEGNSANVIIGKDCKNKEGKKGTGFKSVYNLFKKVVITSGPVECTLEDKPVEIKLDDQDNPVVKDADPANDAKDPDKWNYPIPEFCGSGGGFNEMGTTTTKIELTLRDDKKIEDIWRMLKIRDDKQIEDIREMPSYDGSKSTYPKEYLFLHRINRIQINGQEVFDRKKLERDYTRKEFVISDIQLEENPDQKNRSEKSEEKKRITVLFPHDGKLIESAISCTLPIPDLQVSLPFYINIPLLELENDRKNLSENHKDQNTIVLKNVFCHEQGLKSLFAELAAPENNSFININNLYRYSPIRCIEGLRRYTQLEEKELKTAIGTYPFIRTVHFRDDKQKVECKSPNELACAVQDQPSKFIFLPDYMYWWFAEKGGLEGFTTDIPFVYYDPVKSQEGSDSSDYKDPENEILEALKNLKGMSRKAIIEGSKDKCEDIRGDIEAYLKKQAKETHNTDGDCLFCTLLGKIWRSEDAPPLHLSKEFILECFLSHLDVDFHKRKFHCLGNRRLEINNEYEKLEIDDYTNIAKYVELIKKQFYDSKNFQENDLPLLKKCFPNLLESPYLKYETGKKPELQYTEVTSSSNEEKFHDVLCQCTSELLETIYDDECTIEEMKKWVSAGKLWQRRGQEAYRLNQDTYYTSKEIEYKDLIQIENGCYAKDLYLKKILHNLDDAIKEKAFYCKADLILIEKVLEKYEPKDWYEPAFEAVESMNCADKQRSLTLFGKCLEKLGRPRRWNDAYGNLIFDLDKLPSDRPLFSIDTQSFTKLPQNILQRFDLKVSEATKNRNLEAIKFQILKMKYEDQPFDISLKDFVAERVYIMKNSVSNKARFCWGVKENKEVVMLLFSGKAFEKMLREVWECTEYSERRPLQEMRCYPHDCFVGYTDSITEEEKRIALEYIKQKKECILDDEATTLNYMIERFDLKCNDRFLNIRGYGDENYRNRKCPICGAMLLAERSTLKRGYLTTKKAEKQNIHLPMVMCTNCFEACRYAESVDVDYGKLQADLQLNNPGFVDIDTVFRIYNGEDKAVQIKVSFLNRLLWKCLLDD